jgi:hypothetical protein
MGAAISSLWPSGATPAGGSSEFFANERGKALFDMSLAIQIVFNNNLDAEMSTAN